MNNHFKVNARVRLDNIRDGDSGTYIPSPANTVGNHGYIKRCPVSSEFYDVLWDNGERNSYRAYNLQLMNNDDFKQAGTQDE